MTDKPLIGTEGEDAEETTEFTPEPEDWLQRTRQLLLRGGPLIALILLGSYLSFATPHFLTLSNLENVARQTAVTAILSIGQTFVILSAGIDLSVGAMTALAGSVAAVMMTSQFNVAGMTIGPVNVWIGLLLAMVVGTLAGLINGLIITRFVMSPKE